MIINERLRFVWSTLFFLFLFTGVARGQTKSPEAFSGNNNIGFHLAEGPTILGLGYERLFPVNRLVTVTGALFLGMAMPCDEWGQFNLGSGSSEPDQGLVFTNFTPRVALLLGSGNHKLEAGLGLHLQWDTSLFCQKLIPLVGYRYQSSQPFPVFFRFFVDYPPQNFFDEPLESIPLGLGFGTNF